MYVCSDISTNNLNDGSHLVKGTLSRDEYFSVKNNQYFLRALMVLRFLYSYVSYTVQIKTFSYAPKKLLTYFLNAS
jgi:hypothetical protein